jgi:hypothetical protein
MKNRKFYAVHTRELLGTRISEVRKRLKINSWTLTRMIAEGFIIIEDEE